MSLGKNGFWRGPGVDHCLGQALFELRWTEWGLISVHLQKCEE